MDRRTVVSNHRELNIHTRTQKPCYHNPGEELERVDGTVNCESYYSKYHAMRTQNTIFDSTTIDAFKIVWKRIILESYNSRYIFERLRLPHVLGRDQVPRRGKSPTTECSVDEMFLAVFLGGYFERWDLENGLLSKKRACNRVPVVSTSACLKQLENWLGC